MTITLDQYIRTLRTAADALEQVRALDAPATRKAKRPSADTAKAIRASIKVHPDTRRAQVKVRARTPDARLSRNGAWTPARRKAHAAHMKAVWARKRSERGTR